MSVNSGQFTVILLIEQIVQDLNLHTLFVIKSNIMYLMNFFPLSPIIRKSILSDFPIVLLFPLLLPIFFLIHTQVSWK